jgi:AcrR family transcriptional regulator
MLQPDAKTLAQANAREARRAALFEEAAAEFNAHGIAGASLSRIARRLGLTRAALYYYVSDRDDLAAQCYRRTCEIMASDLAAVSAEKGKGLDKVAAFLRRALDPERPVAAVLSELDHLAGKARDAVAEAHARNVEALRSLVRSGIAEGSIRACDDEIVAHTLIGIVFWIPLSVDWVEGTDATYRARTRDMAVDFVLNGEAADPDYDYVPPVGIESFFPAPANVFDRKATGAAKIDQILMTASQMFNRRGIDGTSLDDITGALGATKGAFYHYFKNKNDLVVRCYRRAFALYERFADASEAYGKTALDRSLTGVYLNAQAQASGLAPLIQMAGASALPPAVRREITRRARALQRRFESFGRQGLGDGSFRAIDFDAMAQLGAGAFEWLPKWFDLSDPRAKSVLARELTTLFIRGLRERRR